MTSVCSGVQQPHWSPDVSVGSPATDTCWELAMATEHEFCLGALVPFQAKRWSAVGRYLRSGQRKAESPGTCPKINPVTHPQTNPPRRRRGNGLSLFAKPLVSSLGPRCAYRIATRTCASTLCPGAQRPVCRRDSWKSTHASDPLRNHLRPTQVQAPSSHCIDTALCTGCQLLR